MDSFLWAGHTSEKSFMLSLKSSKRMTRPNDPISQVINQLLLLFNMNTNGDRSLQFLESLNSSSKPNASILKQLAHYYEKHDDLPMAIAYYRAVIEECGLPPNSLIIVDAYHSIGSAFAKLHDNESALWNYNQAHNLLLQHHHQTADLSVELLEFRILHSQVDQYLDQITRKFAN